MRQFDCYINLAFQSKNRRIVLLFTSNSSFKLYSIAVCACIRNLINPLVHVFNTFQNISYYLRLLNASLKHLSEIFTHRCLNTFFVVLIWLLNFRFKDPMHYITKDQSVTYRCLLELILKNCPSDTRIRSNNLCASHTMVWI